MNSSAHTKSSYPEWRDAALVLGGGNALGAYLGSAFGVVHEQGLQPSWIVGASVGAVTGAIISGNAPEDRIPKLGQFWAEATDFTPR